MNFIQPAHFKISISRRRPTFILYACIITKERSATHHITQYFAIRDTNANPPHCQGLYSKMADQILITIIIELMDGLSQLIKLTGKFPYLGPCKTHKENKYESMASYDRGSVSTGQ